MSGKFVPGDVVVLKSGGPLLTVWHVEDDIVNVIWMNRRHVRLYGFAAICLIGAESCAQTCAEPCAQTCKES